MLWYTIFAATLFPVRDKPGTNLAECRMSTEHYSVNPPREQTSKKPEGGNSLILAAAEKLLSNCIVWISLLLGQKLTDGK